MAKKPTQFKINEDDILTATTTDDPIPGKRSKKPQPAYRVYSDARIPVSKAMGPLWEKKYKATMKANEYVWAAWEEVIRYYNNNQTKSINTSTGLYRRGDMTENVLFSNINLMIPAVVSKNPDYAVNTTDDEDEEFTKAAAPLLNAILRRKDYLAAKPKIRKAVGMSLLTNMGVFKIEWTKKEDSLETVLEEMATIGEDMQKTKDQKELNSLYGKLMALESQVEVSERSGPKMKNVLPSNLLVDPNAEDPDGCDGMFMLEDVLLPTEFLKAKYAVKDEDGALALAYKPTHKISIGEQGNKEDGLGMVLQKFQDTVSAPESYSDEERLAYQYSTLTECVYVWDRVTRRVMLFLKDDWTWPLWVWDDPLKLSRFYPYFIIQFAFSTSGTTSVGETTYYLDQQDEINDINRQVSRIRRAIFDYLFWDEESMERADAENLMKALRGESTAGTKHAIGIKVPENKKLSEMVMTLQPPSAQHEALFNKEPTLNAINRLTNTSDALRGVQFKTNTNEAAVQSYQDAVKLSVGSKVDTVEDVLGDLGHALLELGVQNWTTEEVAGIIGKNLASGWKQMTTEDFNANYSCETVSGSTEKPNSTFKKKEAVQIAQAVGQFAQAAPGAVLGIMLRVLEQAFTEVVIKPEDWDRLEAEVNATLTKGVSTPGAAGAPGPNGQTPGPAAAAGAELDAMRNVPRSVKQKVLQMKEQGVSPEEIKAFIQQNAQGRPGPNRKEAGNGPQY